MVQKNHVVEVRFDRAPDPERAVEILAEITRRKPVHWPRKVDQPLALYGAGKLGKMAKEYLDAIGIAVVFVVDANAAAYAADPFWAGVRLIAPDQVTEQEKAEVLLAVCVATVPYARLRDFLTAARWPDFVPFYDITEAYHTLHPLRNGWFSGPLSAEEIARTERILKRWSDDASRAHHLQFIAWHYLREEWEFAGAPVTTGDRYFIPEVVGALHDDEAFADLGAYHGESTARFLELVGERYRAVWIAEPDRFHLKRLRERFEGSDPAGRIHLLDCAIGGSSGKNAFYEGLGFASQFSGLGQSEVETRTIDELGIEPTFIKTHLEGADYTACRGGMETIRRCRPIIAATTYHSRLGIEEFPRLIMEGVSDYRFYLRIHSWGDTGSVLYAIPAERPVR